MRIAMFCLQGHVPMDSPHRSMGNLKRPLSFPKLMPLRPPDRAKLVRMLENAERRGAAMISAAPPRPIITTIFAEPENRAMYRPFA